MDSVPKHIQGMVQNDDPSLKALSLKLAMLMALTTMSMCAELHKLKPQLMVDPRDSNCDPNC